MNMERNRGFSILCAGDAHLGKRSSRIPASSGSRDLSTAAGWSAFVDAAVARRVDAVVLTGDIVDRENRFFEAFGPLLEGIRRLSDARIEVFAVSGNHDFDVFPRLLEQHKTERFHLLGRGGEWERAHLIRNGKLLAYLDGWSFPAARHTRSPLEAYALPASGETPCIGLMHADLDQTDSPYAPVSSTELRAQPVHLWLLGHIHRPHNLPGAPPICYPGSLQAMDPGEPGAHGALLIEIDGLASPRITLLPLSPVRYESLAIDISECSSLGDLEGRVARGVKAAAQKVADETESCRFLSLRVALQGRTPLHHRMDRSFSSAIVDELRPVIGSLQTYVESIRLESQPAKDLIELARGSGIVSELAQIILHLQKGELPTELQALTESVEAAVEMAESAAAYRELLSLSSARESHQALVRDLLLRQSARLLDALLDQKGG
jgi:DNA repair protein SbcD/Mre11